MEKCLQAGAGIGTLHFPDSYFPSDGYSAVHDDMHAKVLLLVQGETQGALVTLELPSIRPWELTDALRRYAAQLLDVPYENLWLIMTHDLSAPHVPKTAHGRGLHMRVLRSAIKAAVCQARKHLQPVRAICCEGHCLVNANRDMHSVDGWWIGIHGEGPSDKTLSLIRFDGVDGKPVAVLYSYALKSSILEEADMSDGKRYASGDVTGCAGSKAEKELGCPVLFVMGAAGEQVPREKASYLALDRKGRFYPVNRREEGYRILETLSDELARCICDIAYTAGVAQPENSPLRFMHRSFYADGQIPYDNALPSPPVLQFTHAPCAGEEIPIWALQIGTAVMLGVKPEVTTPIFEQIKAVSPFSHTLMATLVNGGQGYIATDWDYDRFTYPALKTPFRRGTDKIFIQKSTELLQAMTSIQGVSENGKST